MLHGYKAAFAVVVAMSLTAAAAFSADSAKEDSKPKQALDAAPPHVIGAAKLIVTDLPKTQAFYEKMFGMKEVKHYNAADRYDEAIMGFDAGGSRLALFSPNAKAEAPLAKSAAPVVLIYTPEFDAVVKRIQDAKYTINALPKSAGSTFTIAIAKDPSGNAVEIFSRPTGKYEVGGSKLIVNDRKKAEDFFVQVFGLKVQQRFQTKGYDEVLLTFGKDAWLALFQPLNEAPLPKSQFPVVAIYTTDFDAVLKRVADLKYGYREAPAGTVGARMAIAKDPAGNAVEIIKR